ncbi:MAG: tetratricopeptide repeat protein [Bacteroidales bacterium]|jgi:tetratricopeptide (TPR) repeat protein|nr:tetratricopeptide repeat protein [Bacteroidales bacterium]
MASLIPGYEYDIFISYRQKDNKGHKWVSYFVDALKTELEATFKEEISIYFDENALDGLQETHNIGLSLETKLKCLIFIPVLSQTYCDASSFAWVHEFKAFNKLASADQFGREIRLRNGNYASRIFAIRIYDLEKEDIILFENETGMALRALDFVFKTSTGVNRPLNSNEDHPHENINKTYYNDQINKAAHLIREIILGMKAEPEGSQVEESGKAKPPGPDRIDVKRNWSAADILKRNSKFFGIVLFLALMILGGKFLYPRLVRHNKLETLRSSGDQISVAIMPFQNLTNDTLLDIYSELIQENLISYLSNYTDQLIVRRSESINYLILEEGIQNYASLSPSLAGKVSRKLDAKVFIDGSIQRMGSTMRLNAHLIDSESEEIFRSFKVESSGEGSRIFAVIDTLSTQVKDFLIISHMKQAVLPEYRLFESTSSPDAYHYYILGNESFRKRDYEAARENYSRALSLDSSFVLASIWLAVVDRNLGHHEEGIMVTRAVYKKRDLVSVYLRNKIDDLNAWYTVGPSGRIRYLNQLIAFDDKDPINYSSLGFSYNALWQYENAIPALERALEIYDKWSPESAFVINYTMLGLAYHKTGRFRKESKLYKKAEKMFPDNPKLRSQQVILALMKGNEKEADEYAGKYLSLLADAPVSESKKAAIMGNFYFQAGMSDKAEKFFREALSINSENPDALNGLAWLLIYEDRNVDEGLELVDRALRLKPDDNLFLDTKGWGLYKKGKYQEAYEAVQKSWDLSRQRFVYNHGVYLRLEEIKKAVASRD